MGLVFEGKGVELRQLLPQNFIEHRLLKPVITQFIYLIWAEVVIAKVHEEMERWDQ